MTPSFQIVEAKPYHCGQMARLLRAEQGESVAALGMDAHRELRDRFRNSSFRKAWLIDGRLAGLGGVEGTLLASQGYLWLALTRQATRHPVAMIKEARRQLEEICRHRDRVETLLIGGDDASLRFAVHVGFVPAGMNNWRRVYRNLGRRMLVMTLQTDPDLRKPYNSGYVIPVSYETEAA